MRARVIALPLLVALACSAAACRRRQVPEAARPAPSQAPAPSPIKIIYPAAPGSFVHLAARLAPSLVALSAAAPVRGGPADWFSSASGGASLPEGDLDRRVRNSLGCGFLLDIEGHVLTNAHVVERAGEILARLQTGSGTPLVVRASVVGRDPESDVALLRIVPPAGTRLVPVRLGDSDSIKVGEWVAALGDFGLGPSLSAGVVVAREVPALPPGRHGAWGMLQIDAAIHPGNSGGPLVNMQGEVVGIGTAMDTQPGTVGFAVPIAVARRIVPMLKREGRVVRAFVGIYMDRVTPDLARGAGLDRARGALVTTVVQGGPAERAGLRAGDIILSFDGKPVESSEHLPRLATLAGVGRGIAVQVWRGGKALSFTLETQKMPE